MKSMFRLFAAAVVIFAFGGCASAWAVVTGSGNIVAYSVELDSFDRIEASNGIRVEVGDAAAFSVTVNADDNLRDYVESFRKDDTLVVRLKDGYSYARCTVRVVVKMPVLESLAASDAVEAHIAGLYSAGSIALSASDGSRISGSLNCVGMVLNLVDASEAELAGSATDLSLSMSDACEADLLSFTVKSARVSLRDACSAKVLVSSSIVGSLEDSSDLSYSGSPSVDVSKKDGSSLVRL